MIIAAIILTIIFAGIALILTVIWPLLPAGNGRHIDRERINCGGRLLPDQPRQGKQPWHTQGQPVIPAPPVPDAYDPGDGILPPVALVRPYLPGAWRCCEHCTDGSPCDPRDSHKTPCGEGCNDPAPLTDAATLAMYRGEWGTMAAERIIATELPQVIA